MSTRPKPSITVDERGVLLHMTDSDGNGITIPLEPASLLALIESGQKALAQLATERGKQLVKDAAVTLWRGLMKGADE